MVETYLGGILPRSETFMRAHWDHAKAFLDDAGLAEAAAVEETRWLQLQNDAGLTTAAPALVQVQDLLRLLCDHADGVAAGQLTRYFETNTFFRQPDVTGAIGAATAPQELIAAVAPPSDQPWILTLPSPYDFLRRCNNDTDIPALELVHQVGKLLNQWAKAALAAGATRIRVHDPSILYARTRQDGDVALLHAGLAALADGIEDHVILHLTNGDPFACPDALAGNPVTGLAIEDPGRAPPAGLQLPENTQLSAAVVHGQESLVETPDAIWQSAHDLAASLGVELWGITNGWDLDHVPADIAAQKVQALGKAVSKETEVIA